MKRIGCRIINRRLEKNARSKRVSFTDARRPTYAIICFGGRCCCGNGWATSGGSGGSSQWRPRDRKNAVSNRITGARTHAYPFYTRRLSIHVRKRARVCMCIFACVCVRVLSVDILLFGPFYFFRSFFFFYFIIPALKHADRLSRRLLSRFLSGRFNL